MFLFDNRIPIVRPYLLIGAAQHERDYALLRESGVTHIIQVGSELRPSFPDRFKYLRISIDDAEQEDLIKHLPRCFKFINDARRRGNDGDDVYHGVHHNGYTGEENPVGGDSTNGAEHNPAPTTYDIGTGNGNGTSGSAGAVLVHCLAGMSRSATVVLTYLMWDEKLPYTEALSQVWEWEAGGCSMDAWNGWSKVRFAERLTEYRRAQSAAGLHPSVRVRLPMSPCASPVPVAGGGGCDKRPATLSGGGAASDGEPDAPSAAGTAVPAIAAAVAADPATPRNVSTPPPANRPIGPLVAVIPTAVTPIETQIGGGNGGVANPAVAASENGDVIGLKTAAPLTAAAGGPAEECFGGVATALTCNHITSNTTTNHETESIAHVWRRLWQ